MSDTSDTESLNAEDVRGGVSDIKGEEEIDEDIPGCNRWSVSLDPVNMRDVFERRAIVMRTIPSWVALDECALGHAGDQTRITRAWKLVPLVAQDGVLATSMWRQGLEETNASSLRRFHHRCVAKAHQRQHVRCTPGFRALGGRCSGFKWENVQQALGQRCQPKLWI